MLNKTTKHVILTVGIVLASMIMAGHASARTYDLTSSDQYLGDSNGNWSHYQDQDGVMTLECNKDYTDDWKYMEFDLPENDLQITFVVFEHEGRSKWSNVTIAVDGDSPNRRITIEGSVMKAQTYSHIDHAINPDPDNIDGYGYMFAIQDAKAKIFKHGGDMLDIESMPVFCTTEWNDFVYTMVETDGCKYALDVTYKSDMEVDWNDLAGVDNYCVVDPDAEPEEVETPEPTTTTTTPAVEEDPVVEDPVVEDPVVEDPAEEDPVVEDPSEEDPVDTTPTTPTDTSGGGGGGGATPKTPETPEVVTPEVTTPDTPAVTSPTTTNDCTDVVAEKDAIIATLESQIADLNTQVTELENSVDECISDYEDEVINNDNTNVTVGDHLLTSGGGQYRIYKTAGDSYRGGALVLVTLDDNGQETANVLITNQYNSCKNGSRVFSMNAGQKFMIRIRPFKGFGAKKSGAVDSNGGYCKVTQDSSGTIFEYEEDQDPEGDMDYNDVVLKMVAVNL